MMSITTKIGIIVVLIAAIIASFFIYGAVKYREGVSDTKLAAKLQVAKTDVASNKITTQVETRYIDKVQIIHDKGETIIKKVPIYVTKQDNDKCIINTGFVRLWNNANGMQVPDPTEFINEIPSNVILSDVAIQHAKEAELTHKTEEQLINLQDWIRKQQLAYESPNGQN